MKLSEQVAIVTGGAGGIGSGIVRCLVAEGAAVAINHMRFEKERADALTREIIGAGGKAIAIEADVSDETQVAMMIPETIEKLGAIHILVNCAGITRDGLTQNLSKEDFEKTVSVNLIGSFLTMRAALKPMLSQNYGRIINISSVVGMLGLRGGSPYAASKAGLLGLTKSTAREVARKGITVNAICPGYVNAGLMKGVDGDFLKAMMAGVPMGKLGEPEDIGQGVVYLASKEAGFITGEILRIDGGMAM